jgi:signal transduction histidine kinase
MKGSRLSTLLFFTAVLFSPAYALRVHQDSLALMYLDRAFELLDVNNDSALISAKKGYEIARELNHEQHIATALARMGTAHYHLGNWTESKKLLLNALEKRRGIDDTVGVLRSQLDLGNFYLRYAQHLRKRGDRTLANTHHQSAIEAFQKAKELAHQLNATYWIQTAWFNLGSAHHTVEDYEEAIVMYQQAMKYKMDTTCVAHAEIVQALASCYYNLGVNLDEAERLFSEARSCFLKERSLFNAGLCAYDLAVMAYNEGDNQKALVLLHDADTAFQQVNDISWQAEIAYFYYEIWTDLGQFEKALDYYIQYKGKNDQLLNRENQASLNALEVQYQTAKKEKENLALRSANQLLFLALGGSVVMIALFVILLVYRNGKRKAERKRNKAEIDRLISEQETKSLNAMMEGQEKERERIAADLHDRLGGMMATVKLLFSSLNKKVDTLETTSRENFGKATQLLDESISEIRKVAHNITSGVLRQFGLVTALGDLLKTIESAQHLKVEFVTHQLEERLDANVEIELYRIVQELVSNCLNHAQASLLSVQLTRQQEVLSLMVEDNGVGFHFDKPQRKKGMGLANVERRVKALKGRMDLDSKPGRGTIINIEIPL